jgi:hypothetical protein
VLFSTPVGTFSFRASFWSDAFGFIFASWDDEQEAENSMWLLCKFDSHYPRVIEFNWGLFLWQIDYTYYHLGSPIFLNSGYAVVSFLWKSSRTLFICLCLCFVCYMWNFCALLIFS